MLTKRLSTMLLCGAAVAGLGASAAKGALFLELRTASVDAAHVAFVSLTPGGKSFTLNGTGAVGATVTMNIVAKSTGSDANGGNDGLLSLAGSFLSTRNGGSPRGNLAASRQVSIAGLNQTSGFNGAGGQNGTVTDLNGDGDLNVGSNNDNDSAGFFAAPCNQRSGPRVRHRCPVRTPGRHRPLPRDRRGYCFWADDDQLPQARSVRRCELVRRFSAES
jgi:hypothetical protein